MEILTDWNEFPVETIDRSSQGKGWIGKKHGVGWARKTVMDRISDIATKDDIVVSMDADTLAEERYLESVVTNFNHHPKAHALAVPYYHRLTEQEDADRAILHYEIYMRNYSINMFRINSPYSFTALGSALAFPVWAYRKIGGMTPVLSGEDFYFLQKMVKTGPVLFWNSEKVYPAARFSDRVYFGTGPAMEKGRKGDWESYPIYHHSLFSSIEKTYSLFCNLYLNNISTPMDNFLKETFKSDDIWASLRNNYKLEEKFIKACHSKIDGLRILQFLKREQKNFSLSDEECILDFFRNNDPDFYNIERDGLEGLNFMSTGIDRLDRIRNRLREIEEQLQIKY